MYCCKLFIAGQIRKTAAALSAVVFLLLLTGCCAVESNARQDGASKRPARKRASEYSRIPGNYPATWQTSTVGN